MSKAKKAFSSLMGLGICPKEHERRCPCMVCWSINDIIRWVEIIKNEPAHRASKIEF